MSFHTAAPSPLPPGERATNRAQPDTVSDLKVGVSIAVGMAALGVLLGFVWQVWSPAGPQAQVLGGGNFIPDETEAFIAGDGRFLAITAAVGLLAALGAWFLRPGNRGVAVAAGLVIGGLAGAFLTELVGHLTGGGSATGHVVTVTGGQYRLTDHLPLSLHMQGMVLIEAALAVLVYGIFVAFTAHDDLGRPDPARDDVLAARAATAPPADWSSVDPGGHPQYGGGYGDAPGSAQQRDFPPQ